MIIPGGRLLQTSSQWRLVFFGLALAALAAFQLFKLPPILPFLLQEYGYDRTLAGAFMSVYALAGLLFSVPLARLLQRQGAALPIKLALCAFAVSNLAIAFLPESGWAVLAARFLEGLAFAVLAVAGPSIANAHAGPRALPLVIGLTAAWIPIGQVIAAALAEPALNAGRWWWLPVGGLGLAALMLLASALLGAGVNFAKPGGGANGPAPTAEERFSLRLSATIFLIFSGQYFAYMTWLTQYLVEEMGLRFHDALIGYLVPVVTLMFWNVLAGLLLKERRRLGWLLQLGMGAMAFGWFVLPYVGTDFFGLASLVLYGIGGGLAPTCLFATPNAILGPGRPLVGAFGTLMTGRNIGVFFGPVVLAELTKGSGGWTLGAPLFGAVTLVGAFLAFWLTRRLAEDRARAA